MSLHKWCSNTPEIVNLIPKEEQFWDFHCQSSDQKTIKTLGIIWSPQFDYFSFKTVVNCRESYTKREVLSIIARLFDPLGFLGPILTKAKLILQKLWVLKLDWDEPLSNPIAKEWNDFVSTLPVIQNIHVPRLVIEKGRIIINGFADASTAAYGAVLYAQSISEEDVSTRLLCSKSRVAPVKPIAIPRFELCAIVTAPGKGFTFLDATYTANDLSKRSNNYIKLLHILSYIFRFLHNSRNPSVKRSGQLDYSEVNEAELCLIKNLQASAFQEEIEFLAKSSCNSKKGKLFSLNPFLDGNQILRVGRRLQNSDLTYSQRHPAILPADHLLTKLIMINIHNRNFHLGPQALLYCTRQRFWPLRGRSIARKIVHECVVCFKNKPIVANQLMGSLPRERVNPSFPFLHTGIDYCGPFFIRYKHQRKGTYQKIYVAIFVCLASKAVHLEIASDLTTDAFLATLKRFVARRGKCATISSDNAKNFVGAYRELKRLHNLIKFPEEKLSSYLSSEGISWNFMPPRAPNLGGLWEAGVKSFKFYLRRAVGNLKMTLEEFLTIITQIEGIQNSRLITPLSKDIDDLEVLTPGHFMIGRSITSISEPNLLDKTENTLSWWQKLTKIVQHIWTKWSRDYLNNLKQRNKWQFHKDNVRLNTMILIKDNLPVKKWSLGRITKLVPGTDGKVRVVEIKTNKGNIKRSIGKVCVLPLDN
ncbi:uncharacterized protein TNCV_4935121 [Trichonephila clavipes]|uniref:Integrase catalytic domain-containing protein n=1 Tax=Trichonephila clavipes TaxID=2585209 RepID=A0A8X6SIU0_TRICX|nr:uncharacterized protein TNCV_4935121 [Trichonephila clavipes]